MDTSESGLQRSLYILVILIRVAFPLHVVSFLLLLLVQCHEQKSLSFDGLKTLPFYEAVCAMDSVVRFIHTRAVIFIQAEHSLMRYDSQHYSGSAILWSCEGHFDLQFHRSKKTDGRSKVPTTRVEEAKYQPHEDQEN